MRRAHARTEMEVPIGQAQPLEHLAGMASRVDDAEYFRSGRQPCREIGIRHEAEVPEVDAAEPLIQRGRVRHDLPDRFESNVKVSSLFDFWLCRRTQDDTGAVLARQFLQSLQTRLEQMDRQRLRFVEDDHALGKTVQLAACAGPVRKKGSFFV